MLSELLNLWPIVVAISVVATGAYIVAIKGYVRVDVGVNTNISIEIGKKK